MYRRRDGSDATVRGIVPGDKTRRAAAARVSGRRRSGAGRSRAALLRRADPGPRSVVPGRGVVVAARGAPASRSRLAARTCRLPSAADHRPSAGVDTDTDTAVYQSVFTDRRTTAVQTSQLRVS